MTKICRQRFWPSGRKLASPGYRGFGHLGWIVDVKDLPVAIGKYRLQDFAGLIETAVDVDPIAGRTGKSLAHPAKIVKRRSVIDVMRYRERGQHPGDGNDNGSREKQAKAPTQPCCSQASRRDSDDSECVESAVIADNFQQSVISAAGARQHSG